MKLSWRKASREAQLLLVGIPVFYFLLTIDANALQAILMTLFIVPAVMLLLPHLGASGEQAGVMLALVSTFAGNLLLVGSIANLIVADLAGQQGVHIGWREHARIGVPVTLLSLGLVWMALR